MCKANGTTLALYPGRLSCDGSWQHVTLQLTDCWAITRHVHAFRRNSATEDNGTERSTSASRSLNAVLPGISIEQDYITYSLLV